MKCYVQGYMGILVAEAEPEIGLLTSVRSFLHILLLFTMLSLYLLQCVYIIQFPVSQVFSSNFKGMVFYLLGLYWTETNYYSSMAVGEFRVSFNCQHFECLTPWNILKYPWRLAFHPL